MQLISPEMYPQLIDIINNGCSKSIDSIRYAELDGNNDIFCYAQQREQQLTIVIEDESDSIKIIDYEDVDRA